MRASTSWRAQEPAAYAKYNTGLNSVETGLSSAVDGFQTETHTQSSHASSSFQMKMRGKVMYEFVSAFKEPE